MALLVIIMFITMSCKKKKAHDDLREVLHRNTLANEDTPQAVPGRTESWNGPISSSALLE